MDLMVLASLLVLAGAASAGPIYSVPVTYVALPSIPENIYNQVQDTKTGEYAFGYAGGPVAREEARTVDGVIRGAYSYVDAHGIVQHYRYIADDGGFRVAGSNIPTDAASAAPVLLEPQLAALKTDAVVAEAAAVVDGSKEATAEAEKSGEAQSRKKRGIVYGELPVAVEALAAPLAIAAVPTATSSQSRVQIHSSLKSEVPVAVAAVPIAAKAIEVLPGAVPVAVAAATPVAVAASVPVATSSQSRYQIHKSLKAEIPVDATAAAPATPSTPDATAAQPIAAKSSEAVSETSTAAASTSESAAISSTMAEKSAKIETSAVEAAEAVAALPPAPAVAAAAPAPKAIAVVPVAAAASVPTATSSQSRFQIHKTLKTVVHDPLIAVPVVAETVRAAAPLVAAIPVAAETLKAIPENASVATAAAPLAATATSNQRLFQVHKNAKLELNALHQPLTYGVLDIHPAVALQPVNSASLPLIARSPVGVGLGVVPSPVAAYYGAALLAQA